MVPTFHVSKSHAIGRETGYQILEPSPVLYTVCTMGTRKRRSLYKVLSHTYCMNAKASCLRADLRTRSAYMYICNRTQRSIRVFTYLHDVLSYGHRPSHVFLHHVACCVLSCFLRPLCAAMQSVEHPSRIQYATKPDRVSKKFRPCYSVATFC